MPTSDKAILSFTSADGIHFEPEAAQPLIVHGASQAQFRDADGSLRTVGTDPTVLNNRQQPGSPTPPRCSTLFSHDGDQAQRAQLFFPPCVNRYGDRASAPKQCVDPAIYALPDGGARLLFVRIAGQGDPAFTAQANQFFSAVAKPGEPWTFEPGVRFESPGAADPDVVPLPGGGFRMYYTRGDARGPQGKRVVPGVFSAVSEDGLTFREEAGTRVHFCSASSTVALDEGGFRMYCHLRDLFRIGPDADPGAYVVSYISADGLSFEKEAGERVGRVPLAGQRAIGAAAPSVSREPDGRWRMLVTTVIEPLFPWNHWVIYNNRRLFERVIAVTKARVHTDKP